MAKAKLERHPAVLEKDLPNIYEYIARDNLTAADSVLDAIEATFLLIAEHPECGVRYRPRHRKWLAGVRVFPVRGYPNYLVFYRVSDETVRVLYVTHGARDLPRLFRREQR